MSLPLCIQIVCLEFSLAFRHIISVVMPVKAVCVLGNSSSGVQGTLLLEQKSQEAPVVIKGEISGLAPGKLSKIF